MQRRGWRRAAAGAAAFTAATIGVLAAVDGTAGAARALAKADLHDAQGTRLGSVTFLGHGVHADRVKVELDLPAGAPGLGDFHGFHIHSVGACAAPFTTAGGHWNTTGAEHGRHAGDLSSVLVTSDGRGYAEFDTDRFDVSQLFDADGSAVILHASPDNFGNVPITAGKYEDPNDWYHAATGTANTGDAGMRYGCGVVEQQ